MSAEYLQNIASTDARLQAALAEYEQSLLRALAEEGNSCQLQHTLARQNLALGETVAHGRHCAEQNERLFELRSITLNQALSAQMQAQQQADRPIQSRLAEAQNLLRLYQTLGSGWIAETANEKAGGTVSFTATVFSQAPQQKIPIGRPAVRYTICRSFR